MFFVVMLLEGMLVYGVGIGFGVGDGVLVV